MVACGAVGLYELTITNPENTGSGNNVFTVDLPDGMEYVPGSVTGIAQEFDISDIEQPIFLFPGLPALSLTPMSFQTIINCSFSNDATVQYTLTSGGDTFTAQEQALANFFFPEVVITDVDHTVLNIAVDASAERTFTIIQSTPGARLDTLFFINNYDPGVSSLGLNVGTLYGSSLGVDTFFVTGADMPGGGGFDFGDTLRLTETMRLLACVQANSTIELFWRCGELVCQSFQLNTLINQASGSPDLRITNTNGFPNQATASNPSLVGGGFCDTLFLTYNLENQGEEQAPGAGAVYDLLLGIGLNNNLFSSSLPYDLGIFPNWSIEATINGTPLNLGTYQYPNPNPLLGYNIGFSQFDFDPDGPGGMDDVDGDGQFDDLPVGASTTIRVAIIYDPYATDECAYLSGFPYNGGAETNFRLGYYYHDQCEQLRTYWYSVEDPGVNVISLFTHRAIIYNIELEETNLFPGQVTNLEIRPDGAWNSPCGATDSIVLEIILPDGLIAQGGAYGPGAFYGQVGQSGDTVWLASTERGTFTQPWGINVGPDCTEAIIDTTVNVSFLYYCSSDCPIPKRIDCQEIPIQFLAQCDDCLEGIDTRDFEVERVNLGWTNAAHTDRVNPLLDPTINLSAAINFDSVDMQLTGIYRGGGPFDSLYARVTYQGMDASFADPILPGFQPIGSDFTYYAVDGNVYQCVDAPILLYYDTVNNVHYIQAELEAFFSPGACLENVNRQAGDSIVLVMHTLVTQNTPRRALPVPELSGQFYLSLNGMEISCHQYLDNFVLEQVVPYVSIAYATQEHYGCEEIYFNNNSIANPNHIYDGDQFPNEVRTIVDVSEVRIILEGNWLITPGSSDLLANGSFDENDAVSVTAPYVIVSIADPIVSFDGNQTVFSYINPGDWPGGDLVIGGSNPAHNIRFRARPGCSVPQGTPFKIRMEVDMIRYLNAPEAYRDTLVAIREDVSKTHLQPQADLFLASPQEYIPNSDIVTWELRLTNTTSYGNQDKLIQNAWLAIEANPEVDIYAIEEVTDPNNPVVFPILNYQSGDHYWIKIGDIQGFSSRNFRILGTYTGCERQELLAKFGYSCTDYPDPDPELGYQLANTAYFCPIREMPLYIQPTNVSLVLDIQSPANPGPLCEELDYMVTVSNLQLPSAYGHKMTIEMPFMANYVPNTSRLEFPANSGNWVNLGEPAYLGNNIWQWDLANDPNGIVTLLGVDQAPNNAYKFHIKVLTHCGLHAGFRFAFRVEARNSCGETEQKIAYSERLLIDGLPTIFNSYGLGINMLEGGLNACDSSRVSAKLINIGPLPISDVEYALMSVPASFGIVPNSINGETALVEELTQEDRRYLRFSLPEGLPAGDSISFDFQLADVRGEALGCGETEITLAAVLETEVDCSLTPGETCTIFLILNSDTLITPIQKDAFSLELVSHESIAQDFNSENVTSVFKINNLDTRRSRTDSLVWDIYFDMNGDGQLDELLDPLIYTSPIYQWHIDPLGFIIDSINYDASNAELCQLIAVLSNPGHSCQCEPYVSIALPPPVVRNIGPDQSLCSGDTITLGLDERISDITFQWQALNSTPTGLLDDPTVAITTFSTQNMGINPLEYQYQLTTDRGGVCSTTDTVNITIWQELRPSASVISNYNGAEISCYEDNDGMIQLDIDFIATPTTYTLEEQSQESPIFENLTAGTYLFEVLDGHGCQTQIEQTITQPDSLQVNFNTQIVSCYQGSDGTITASVLGGTLGNAASYTYQWSIVNSPNTNSIINLNSGWHPITIQDSNDCFVIDSVFLDQVQGVDYELDTDSTSCWYSADGTARLDSLGGGTVPYEISWSNGLSGLINNSFSIGQHTLIIQDDHACEYRDTFFVEGPPAIEIIDIRQQDASCFAYNDGYISLDIIGGTGAFTYDWNTGQTTDSIANLIANDYQISIVDENNCLLTSLPITIAQPDILDVLVDEIQHISCFGLEDGAITVLGQGGTAPYFYNWDNGIQQNSLDSLDDGFYTISISDNRSCLVEKDILIEEPFPLTNTLTQIDPDCFGDNGFLVFNTQGGTAPYQYSIDEGLNFVAENQIAAPPGAYTLLIQDAHHCTHTDAATLVAPPALILEGPEEIIINYGDTIQLNTYVYNVRGDSLIQWRPPIGLSCDDCLDPIASPAETQVYYLKVSDSFNCFDELRIPVIVRHPRRYYLPNAFSPNGDSENDILYPFGANEVALIKRFEIYNRWGSQVFAADNFPPNNPHYGWNGRLNGRLLPTAVYVYLLEVEFTDGAVELYKGDVILMR